MTGWLRRLHKPPIANAYYVALGSSFAAGLGLGRRAAGSPVISMRSVNGYPQQLARLLKFPSFTDMTSSGSTVRQVLRGGQMGLGPQIEALGLDTRLVTLTAGGNDIGYVGDLTAMAFRNRGGLMSAVVGMIWKGGKPVSARSFGTLDGDLRELLSEIRRRSPLARIVVVTYPTILPDVGTCEKLGLTENQAVLMRAVAAQLALVTRDAAASLDAMIVDMAALSANHNACSQLPWVNGFKPEAGAKFHPTLAGATATAQAIAEAIEAPGPKSG